MGNGVGREMMGASEDANEDVLGRKLDIPVSTLLSTSPELSGWTYMNHNSSRSKKAGES